MSADRLNRRTRVFERAWRDVNVLSILLLPLSWLYRLLFWLKKVAYKWRIVKCYRAPRPVIVVGNISVGGTGKTPFTIWLCEWLQSKGFKPGVILRGYRGNSTQWPVAVSNNTQARQVGDEAQLLFERLQMPVVAGPNRSDDCQRLLADNQCDVIVCDDGLQHFALCRDYEIALCRQQDGNNWCLPAGPLRESRSRLAHVDLCVKVDGVSADISSRVSRARNLQLANCEKSLTEFKGQRVLAITGIANPKRFFDSLASQDLVFEKRIFPDHHPFSVEDIDPTDYDAVLMTEKDAIKCTRFVHEKHWCVVLELEISRRLVDSLESTLLPRLTGSRD
jgi:tetraacyldisaccharide 4'-kinase